MPTELPPPNTGVQLSEETLELERALLDERDDVEALLKLELREEEAEEICADDEELRLLEEDSRESELD